MEIEDLLKDPSRAEQVRELFADIDRRIDESSTNYRFVMQMIGEHADLPNKQVLALIIAASYVECMRNWDGQDMFLPVLFAELTVRQVMKDDH